MEYKLKNYGFSEEETKIEEEDYLSGILPREVVNPSANWEEWLPVFEHQAEKYETWGCTAYGTLNQIETYMKKVFGFEPNYSDRFTYILANISPPGAPPSRAYEAIRKKGVIDQALLPYADTYEEFIEPNPMLSGYIKNALEWHSKYKFNHEWIKDPTPDKIQEELKFSPIDVSVTAWIEQNGLFVDKGQRNTHWCEAFYVNGSKPVVFDTYNKSIKTLHPDHHIKYAKRIRIVKRAKPLPPLPAKSLWKSIWADWRLLNWRIKL